MKFLVCPQCGINRFYLKDLQGNRLLVRVSRDYEIIPIHPDDSLEGFLTEELFCLGCSWSGAKTHLVKYLK